MPPVGKIGPWSLVKPGKGEFVRKLLSLGLILPLTIVMFDQAHAVVKAGAKCQKISATQTVGNIKFTCIKSGSKLVWNKGVAITNTPSPTPTPSAPVSPVIQAKSNSFVSTPFPDEFTRAEMVEAMFKSFNEFIKRKPNVNSYKLIIDSEFQTDSAAISKLVSDVYSILPFPVGYPTTVVIFSDNKEFIEKSIKDNGFAKEGFQESGYFCRNCAGYGWATSKSPLSSITTHEMFHIWQRAAYQRNSDNGLDPRNPLNPPVWFDEGGADFFGEAMFSKSSSYYQVPRVRWQPTFKLKDYTTREIDRYLPYYLGHAASEYIVASKGMDNFLQVYSNVGKGQDFPTAFENALGITLDAFYLKFDRVLEKIL